MTDFNSIRNNGFVGSVAAIGAGIVLYFTPMKGATNFLAFAGVGSLAATIALVDASEKIGERSKKALEDALTQKNFELINAENDTRKLAKAFKDWEILEAEYKQEKRLLIEEYKEYVTKQDKQFAYYKKELELQGQELLDLKNISAEQAANLLAQSLEHFRSTINGILDLLARKYPTLAEELVQTRQDYIEYLSDYEAQIEVIRSYTEALQIIESSIAVQHQIVFKGSLIKLGAYKKVEKFLRAILSESITVEKHNEIVDNLNAEYAERKAKLQVHYNGNYQAILAEYQNEVDGKCEQFQAELSDICNQGLEDAERIEKLETAINESYRELTNALQSHRFPGNTEQARIGNDISRYYAKLGYILDAMEWQTSETGYTLIFHTSRNGNKHINADMLNDGDNPEKLKELSNALNLPKFEVNYRGGTVSVEIQKTAPTKKEQLDELSDEAINRLARSWDTWKKHAKKWNRIRITGGSGAGKSPLTERIVSEQLQHKKVKGLEAIKLYNPQAGSRKDNWSFPSVGKTHQDSIRGIAELTGLCGRKYQGSFGIWIFDEIDSTLRQAPGKKRPTADEPEPEPTMSANMLSMITQIDHTSQAVFYLGQGANTGKIPNTTKGDWNNLIAIHINGNAKDYLRLADHIDTESKDKLMKQADLLQRYIDRKNLELGLDRVDPGAYRYALIDEYGEKQYYVLLPLFSADEFLDSLSTPQVESDNPVVESLVQIQCPHCGSEKFKKNRSVPDADKYRYLCLNLSCGKTFVADRLTNSN